MQHHVIPPFSETEAKTLCRLHYNNISTCNDSIDKIVLESGWLPGIIRIVSQVSGFNSALCEYYLHEWSKVLNLLKSHRSKL